MGCIVPAIPLDHPTGKPGQSRVPASFLNDMTAIAALVHPGIEILLFQQLVQRLGSGQVLDLWIFGPVKETGRIQSLGINIRKDRSHLLFHVAVGTCIRSRLDLQKRMELRSCRFSVFLLQVVAAVMDADRHLREGVLQILWCDPVVRIIRVIIVKLHRKAVARDEVGVAAVAVFIFRADIIP